MFHKFNRNIVEQANFILINNFPRFPPYFRCKLGVTFARRCFRDVLGSSNYLNEPDLNSLYIILSPSLQEYNFKFEGDFDL